MKRFVISVALGLVGAFPMAPIPAAPALAIGQDETDELQQEIDDAQDDLDEAHTQLQEDIDGIRDQLDELQYDVGDE